MFYFNLEFIDKPNFCVNSALSVRILNKMAEGISAKSYNNKRGTVSDASFVIINLLLSGAVIVYSTTISKYFEAFQNSSGWSMTRLSTVFVPVM